MRLKPENKIVAFITYCSWLKPTAIKAMKQLCIIILFLTLVSCKNSVEKLMQEAKDPDTSLLAEKESNGVSVKLYTVPSDYYAVLELDDFSACTDSLINTTLEKYRKNIYLLLSFSASGHDALYAGRGDYRQLVQQMAFNMAENIILSYGNDTVTLVGSHFPRFYGLSNSSEVLLAYKRPVNKSSDNYQMKINEFGLGAGNLNFSLKANDMAKQAVISASSYKKYRNKIKPQ